VFHHRIPAKGRHVSATREIADPKERGAAPAARHRIGGSTASSLTTCGLVSCAWGQNSLSSGLYPATQLPLHYPSLNTTGVSNRARQEVL
jgi:hypothetical protein